MEVGGQAGEQSETEHVPRIRISREASVQTGKNFLLSWDCHQVSPPAALTRALGPPVKTR